MYHSRGVVWYELGEHAPALEDFNRAIDLGLRQATLYNNRGLAHAQQHDYWDAVSDFDDALALDPDAPIAAQILLNRGTVYGGLQDFTRAIDDYDQDNEGDHDEGQNGAPSAYLPTCKAHEELGKKARHWEHKEDQITQFRKQDAHAQDGERHGQVEARRYRPQRKHLRQWQTRLAVPPDED